MFVVLLLAFLFGVYAFAGGGLATAPVTPEPGADKPEWTQQPTIDGFCCNYAPIVIRGHTLQVYSNTNRATPPSSGEDGVYWLRQGTLGALGPPVKVLQTPAGQDAYIRTSAVAVDQGRYYALLFTGESYPGKNGYSPSWAESPDGIQWTWKGHVSPWPRAQSGAGALIVNDRTDEWRFQAWVDNVGRKVAMMHSADGQKWIADPAEVLPAELLADNVEWLAAARTPWGVHIMYSAGFSTTAVRHLWSCDGWRFRVLELDAPLRNPTGKGVHLAYDAGLLHAAAVGLRWTTPARGWAC